MGFAGYFLIVSDFIKAGRDMAFLGPGEVSRRFCGGVLYRHHQYRSYKIQPAV